MAFSVIQKFIKWKNRCRACCVDGIDISLINQFKELKLFGPHKSVSEYICERCGTTWILAHNSRFLNKIVNAELYDKWKSHEFQPSAKQKELLGEIGGVYDADKVNLYFPCKVKFKDGTVKNRVEIIATYGDWFGKFPLNRNIDILGDDHEIMKSEHSLPVAVRMATMTAPERSMGYAPVNAIDVNGLRYTLSSRMHFFDQNGIRGPLISLDDSKYHGKNIVNPELADMYLICDMFV